MEGGVAFPGYEVIIMPNGYLKFLDRLCGLVQMHLDYSGSNARRSKLFCRGKEF